MRPAFTYLKTVMANVYDLASIDLSVPDRARLKGTPDIRKTLPLIRQFEDSQTKLS